MKMKVVPIAVTLVTLVTLSGTYLTWKAKEDFAEAANYAHKIGDSLFDHRIKTYILTSSCARYTSHLTEYIPQGTFVLDSGSVPDQCQKYENWDHKTVPHDPELDTPPKSPAVKHRPPQTPEETAVVLKNPDHKFRTPEFQKWMEWVEPKYRRKYAHALRLCSQGSHELCMLLEDDIVFVNEPQLNIFRLAVQTFFKHSGPQVSWDCSKIGNGWRSREIDGNKSQCRIVHRKFTACLADFFDHSGEPADIALAAGMRKCGMEQRWFLLVQHVGRKSEMGHDN